ncbi:MAG TPA: chromosomal replication initiator protein DnaA [Candidatus Saccharimonadales bacterium]|nr:chromosomal replication initiator protein DnaA [Candidatus Saccharimonadales bacterium]
MNVLNDQIWQDFLKIIAQDVGTRVVETWIKAVTISRYDASTGALYLSAPNLFVKNWVESNYKEFFAKHLKRLLGTQTITIHFVLGSVLSAESVTDQTDVVHGDVSKQPVSQSDTTAQELSKIIPATQAAEKKKKFELVKKMPGYHMYSSRLNPAYTFDTFVVGENNQFAYASAKAVANKPGSLYNPLFLYGSCGLGKTHLLHAIGNEIVEKDPNVVVLYQTTDRFITEFINAVRFDSVPKFQAKYKDIDVLLIDDIQFMVNKEQTQELFFHIFNSLYESDKQIVLSCDVLPRYLGGLVERLKSRLEWGLIADVQLPTVQTKIAILKRKAYMQREVLSDEVAQVIAQRDINSIRELEGCLIRVLAYASLTNQNITIDLVKKVLGAQSEFKQTPAKIDFKDILQHIKKHFSYSLEDLRSKDRSKGVSHARQVAMYLLKRNTDKSLREIGEFLDRKDHTTITHAIARITDYRLRDEKFSNLIKMIEDELV